MKERLPARPAEDDDLSGPYVQEKRDGQEYAAARQLLRQGQSQPRTAPTGPAGPTTADKPKTLLERAWGAAGDVALGVTLDVPRAFTYGLRDAGQEVLDLAQSVGNWLAEQTGLPGTPGENPLQIPEPPIDRPQSNTGEFLKQAVQFMTGFKGAGTVVKGAGVAASMAKGAISDFTVFDGHQANLANLWKSWGLPDNILTDTLASSPDDSEALGRFKNALQGVGLGVVTEGLGRVVNTLRTARAARQNPIQAPDVAGESAALPQVTAKDFDILGDASQEKLIAKRAIPVSPIDLGVPDEVAAKGLTRAPHEPEFFINWARIDTPDDVKNVMAQAADAFRPGIETARRGKVSWAETKASASQLNGFKILKERRVGEVLNSEQTEAARGFYTQVSTKLAEVAELAASNPSDANLFAFRKVLQIHDWTQQQILGARAEAARGLNAWRITSSPDAIRAREVSDLLGEFGGVEANKELAGKLSFLLKGGKNAEADAVVRKATGATTMDMVREAWINGLLTNPATHEANFISNAAVVVMQMGERAAAARLGRLLGSQNGVELGEATAQWSGMINGWKDSARYAWKMLKTGESSFKLPGSKLDDRPGAISARNVNALTPAWMNVAGGTGIGRAIDGVGNVVRGPGRALASGDQFFQSIGYRMELNAQASRIARQEAAAGAIKPSMVQDRIAEILNNPPKSVQLAAADQALYATFNQAPGKLASLMIAAKRVVPAFNILIPFVRTPANIFKYVIERGPLALGSKQFWADIRAGGARQDLALTKLAVGSYSMAAIADLVLAGHITGKGTSDRGQRSSLQRDDDWMPYSIKIGDRWYAYTRLDPIGMTIGIVADMVEVFHNTEWDKNDNKDADEVAAAVATAIANNTMSKTYMEGMSNFFEAMGDKSGTLMKRFFERTAGSLIPAGVAAVERGIDPTLREANGMIETMQSRLPYYSEGLPPVRDLWGREKKWESGFGWAFDMFSPIYFRRGSSEPIDLEIRKQGWTILDPPRTQNFAGVAIDLDRYPGAYSRFLQLTGQEIKHPRTGLNMLDHLNAIVSGKSPLSRQFVRRTPGPDGGQEAFIKHEMEPYRVAARVQLAREYPGLAFDIQERKRRKAEAKKERELILQ